jgi:hypothetical protein
LDDGSIAVDAVNAQVLETEGNRMRLAPLTPEFQLSVTGFDEHRNLVVRVTDR